MVERSMGFLTRSRYVGNLSLGTGDTNSPAFGRRIAGRMMASSKSFASLTWGCWARCDDPDVRCRFGRWPPRPAPRPPRPWTKYIDPSVFCFSSFCRFCSAWCSSWFRFSLEKLIFVVADAGFLPPPPPKLEEEFREPGPPPPEDRSRDKSRESTVAPAGILIVGPTDTLPPPPRPPGFLEEAPPPGFLGPPPPLRPPPPLSGPPPTEE
mmetsp:Transcript_5334/g.17515  ORF Transcript_5334/g.17515 Transcript_5334/m.17515 type:complete len:209 (+) Transcript_5334:514-1140(+)